MASRPWSKFLLRTYLNFTIGQERFSPGLMHLRAAALRAFPNGIPAALQSPYRTVACPLFKWIGLLMTNTRMLILFAVLILGHPTWYFWVELTALNLVLTYCSGDRIRFVDTSNPSSSGLRPNERFLVDAIPLVDRAADVFVFGLHPSVFLQDEMAIDELETAGQCRTSERFA